MPTAPLRVPHYGPLWAPEPLQLLDTVIRSTASGAPAVVGVLGVNDRGLRAVGVAGETPIPCERLAAPQSKADQEWAQVLQLQATNPHLLQEVVQRVDPPAPDFEVIWRGRRARLECKRLTWPERREHHAFLRSLRRRLLDEPHSRFGHLRGLRVCLIFREPLTGIPGRPPRPRTPQEREVIDALAAHFATRQIPIDGAAGPPWLAITDSPAVYAWSIPMGPEPESPLFAHHGFEISTHTVSWITRAEVGRHLRERIDSAVKTQADVVLVSLSSPDQYASVYLSERLAGRLAFGYLGDSFKLSSPGPEIVVHDWASDQLLAPAEVLNYDDLSKVPILAV